MAACRGGRGVSARGLIAEDLPDLLPPLLRDLLGEAQRGRAPDDSALGRHSGIHRWRASVPPARPSRCSTSSSRPARPAGEDGLRLRRSVRPEGDGNLERLYAEAPAYRAIADTIRADVAELRAEIEAGGRPLREFTAVETGRVMDMRWLSTNAARFRLVGMVNRLDRRDFHDLLGERAAAKSG